MARRNEWRLALTLRSARRLLLLLRGASSRWFLLPLSGCEWPSWLVHPSREPAEGVAPPSQALQRQTPLVRRREAGGLSGPLGGTSQAPRVLCPSRRRVPLCAPRTCGPARADEGNRAPDLRLTMAALYQLSYVGTRAVGGGRTRDHRFTRAVLYHAELRRQGAGDFRLSGPKLRQHCRQVAILTPTGHLHRGVSEGIRTPNHLDHNQELCR